MSPDDQRPAEPSFPDERSRLDELADEGYRVTADDTARFVEDTWPTAGEGWPEWNEDPKSGGADADRLRPR